MKKVVLAIIFAAAISLISHATSSISSIINPYLVNKLWKAPPAETISFNDTYDFGGMYLNYCNGEVIELTGRMHFSYHFVINKNKIHSKYHWNTQGVSGVGLETGTKYQIIEITNALYSASVEGCYVKTTLIATFKYVSAGPGDNYLGKLKTTYIYSSCTGQLVDIIREELSIECK